MAFNLNVRVSVGAISDYPTSSGLQDAIKRIYVGVGGGIVVNDVILSDHTGSVGVPPHGITIPNKDKLAVIPINLGTNINLPGIFGPDKLELNPNYQYNYVNSPFLDGLPKATTSKINYSAYNLFSLSLKFKF
jgi:hypothetical protein